MQEPETLLSFLLVVRNVFLLSAVFWMTAAAQFILVKLWQRYLLEDTPQAVFPPVSSWHIGCMLITALCLMLLIAPTLLQAALASAMGVAEVLSIILHHRKE